MMVHSTLVFQHQRGKARSPGCQSCTEPSHSICSFPPPQRPASLGEGQSPWLCGVCVHVCLREWAHTSVQSPAADQLLT